MKAVREILLENWTFKLTAILLATILWMVVRNDDAAERVITVPLEARIPRNMEITNERPSSVEVTVRGSTGNMWFAQPMPTCLVDLQSADEGEHTIPLTPDNIRIPRTSGIDVVLIRPARITLVLERTISTEVPVIVPIRGEPAPDFDVYGKFHAPSNVIISGPRTRVEKIKEISTDPVSIEGLKTTTRTLVNLNIKDNAIHTSQTDPVEVVVEIGVHRQPQTISNVPVTPEVAGFSVTPTKVAVQVSVPVDFKRKLVVGDFNVTVPAVAMAEEEVTAKVRPEVRFTSMLDERIVIRDTVPGEVTVHRSTRK
jgi:YbbR domain-containing protein